MAVALVALTAVAPARSAALEPIATFGGSGPGQIVAPGGIATGSGGAVYVADFRGNRVEEFSSSGSFVRAWGAYGTKNGATPAPDGAFAYPRDLATSPNGDVYVADTSNNRVQRFDANGVFLGKWGAGGGAGDAGSTAGAFSGPQGVGTDPSGDVYVADWGNHRVQRFTAAGAFLGAFGTEGSGDGQFFGPNDVAVGADGSSYVADGPDGRVDKFSAAGTFLEHWYFFSGAVETFVDGNGDVYVVDLHNAVFKYTQSGTLLGALREGDYVGGRCLDAATVRGPYVYVAQDASGGSGGCDGERGDVVKLDMRQPTAQVSGPAEALTGHRIAFDASASSVPFAKVRRYEWDLDGNGSFETDTGRSPHATHAYRRPRVVRVRVRTTSAGGESDVAGLSLDVRRAPPPGPVGVSIDRGARFTNDRRVKLWLVWPAGTRTATISNDGGFGRSRTVAVHDPTTWTLDPRGADRLPRTVYVRFDHSTQTFSDDVVLDEGRPVIRSATLTATGERSRGKRIYQLRTRASDEVSGVTGMQVTTDRDRPAKLRSYRRKRTVRIAGDRVYVRVRDAAGNYSRWRTAAAAG